MAQEAPQLSPLKLRRQMLIAESEVNRTLVLQEWDSMTIPVRGFAGRAKSFGSMASCAAALATGLFTFRRGPRAPATAKPSWLNGVVAGVRLAASIALAFREKKQNK